MYQEGYYLEFSYGPKFEKKNHFFLNTKILKDINSNIK